MPDAVASGRAQARLGLLGNPSDGYGGRVIAATVADFGAVARACPAPQWTIRHDDNVVEAGSIFELRDAVGDSGGRATLVGAALAIVSLDAPEIAEGPPLELSAETTVPREVGLAGSSAIVTATLRAVVASRGVALTPSRLAELTLGAEVRVLGWAAGPQDRIIQAHGGALDMDFGDGWRPDAWKPIDPSALPPLIVAWDTRTTASSDVVHRDVRTRWEAGDAEVVASMGRFAELAAEGSHALAAGEAAARWPDLLDESYGLRERFWHLTARDRTMIELARAHDIGASLAGSGGAIVGVARDPERVDGFLAAINSSGARAMVPTIGRPAAGGR